MTNEWLASLVPEGALTSLVKNVAVTSLVLTEEFTKLVLNRASALLVTNGVIASVEPRAGHSLRSCQRALRFTRADGGAA